MLDEKIYHVTECLPDNGQKVSCYGHKTFCCSEDMEKDPDWYEVIFEFSINSYKIKEVIPSDPEESILCDYSISECWKVINDPEYHVIGVKMWK